MTHRFLALAFVPALSAFACSSSSSTPAGTPDGGKQGDSSVAGDSGSMSDAPVSQCPPLDASGSKCGHPGDKGNSLGVGQFCSCSSDCTGSTANLCATAGGSNDQTFCTFLCTPPASADGGDGGDEGGTAASDAGNPCGENASCACNGGPPCGCVPNVCLGM